MQIFSLTDSNTFNIMKFETTAYKIKHKNLLNSMRPVLHPDVFWYCLNGIGAEKNAPKKVLVTLFPYIFHVKTKWNIVYEYLNTNIFSRDTNILPPQMHWTSNIFGPSATTIGSFWVSPGLQIIFQNLSDIMSGRHEILSDIYENLLDINFYKNSIKSL